MALVLGLLIFSFVVTALLIVPFINALYKVKFTRRKEAPQNKRKIPLFDKLHDWKAGTPVGGGLLIIGIVSVLFFSLFPVLSYLGVKVTSAFRLESELRIIFLAFIGFGLLGLYDDLVKFFGKPKVGEVGMSFGITKRWKFFFQCALALVIAFLMVNDLGITIIHIPILSVVTDLSYWYILLAAFFIVAFTNAFNITDGLDGLATGLLVICLFVFWVIAGTVLDTPLTIFIALWLGALFAFLYFNVWPARIFLGDAGALSFGATLAVVGLLTGKIIALGIIGGIFVAEVGSSLLQLLWKKVFKRPLLPMAPIHLLLQSRGWEEPKIVMRAWLAGAILAIFGLWLAII